MHRDVVEDLMRLRFGWGTNSSMPALYALRALSDLASLTVLDYMDALFTEAARAKSFLGLAP